MKIHPSIHPSKSNRALTALLLVAGLSFASTSSAGLIAKLNGLVVYDTDRNITWLADANLAGTPMTWATAKDWAANLVYVGFDDWRLPTALNADGSGPCQGYNCTGSELGHLFYQEIGVTEGNSILNGNAAELTKFNNIQSYVYWSATGVAPSPNGAWDFDTDSGSQTYDSKDNGRYGWAVRSGDVSSTSVPEPGIIGLLLAGGIGWVGTKARRRG